MRLGGTEVPAGTAGKAADVAEDEEIEAGYSPTPRNNAQARPSGGDRSPGKQSRRLSRYRWAPYTCLSEPASKFSPDTSSCDTGGSSTHVGDNRRKRNVALVR